MAKNNHIINSFGAGEASPKFRGRSETQQYNQSCEDTLNMVIYPQGGAGTRGGTIFVERVKDRNGVDVGEARLFPFNAADGSRWQICITKGNPDAPGGYAPGDPLNWFAINTLTGVKEYIFVVNTSPIASTYLQNYYMPASVDLIEIQKQQAADVLFLAHKNMRSLKIQYSKNPITGVVSFVGSPVLLDIAAQPSTQLWRQMPFQNPVFTTGNMQLKVTTDALGAISIRPGTTLSTGVTFDAALDIGRYFKFSDGAGQTRVVIAVNWVSATELRGYLAYGTSFGNSFSKEYGNSTTGYYEDGFWSERLGWPKTVAFFETRLVFGGSRTFPDTIWFSAIGDITRFDVRKAEQDTNFLTAQSASDPFATNLRSETIQDIRWILSGKTLTVGTATAEYVVQGPNSQKSIGIDNIQTNEESPHGSAYVQAAKIENTAVFLQRHRGAVRELVYNLDENSFKAADLSIVGEHMKDKTALAYTLSPTDLYYVDNAIDGYFVQMVMQQVPVPILWTLDRHGQICALTRERNQEVNAWHYHKIAGSYAGFVNNGGAEGTWPAFTLDARVQCLSISLSPQVGTSKLEPDDLWMTVKRAYRPNDSVEKNSHPVVHIERMSPEWKRRSLGNQWETTGFRRVAPVYMDCAMIVTNADTPTNGLLETTPYSFGQKVAAIVDGVYAGEFTMGNTGLDLRPYLNGRTTWKAVVGLKYDHFIVPMSSEVPATIGTSQGQPRRIDQITTHFYRTAAAKYGRAPELDQENTPTNALEQILFKPGVNQTDPIPLFTGDKKVDFPQGWVSRPKIIIKSDVPLPMQITHIVARMVVSE